MDSESCEFLVYTLATIWPSLHYATQYLSENLGDKLKKGLDGHTKSLWTKWLFFS